MRFKVSLLFFWLVLYVSGCARLTVEQYSEYFPEKNITVQVEVDKNLTSWWGPLKVKLRDKIVESLKDRFRESPLYLVNKNADIVVMVQDIITFEKTDRMRIEEVTLSVRDKNTQIFKVRYKQRFIKFPDNWYKVWAYAKGAEWISQILADRIVRELGIKRILMREEEVLASKTKQQPPQRPLKGYIIYQPR